jgi:hypothetical protein
MLSQSPIVFVSKKFILNYLKLKQGNWTNYTIDEKKILIFLELLLESKSQIYIDLSENEIYHIRSIDHETIHTMENISEKNFHLIMMKIFNNGMSVNSCLHHLNDYLNGNLDSIKNHDVKPNYIFVELSTAELEYRSKSYGLITLASNLKVIHRNIYELHIKTIDKDDSTTIKKIEKYFDNIPNSSEIIIQDPYILKQSKEFIKKIVHLILDLNTLKLKPTVTIIADKDQGDANKLCELQKEDGRFILEFIDSKLFHDRNIYTNSTWISSDYGFMNRYGKGSTKWCGYPIGEYYDIYYKKLNEIKAYLTTHRTITRNSLIS